MTVLDSPFLPALLAMISVTAASLVIVEVIGFISMRYRDRYLQEAALELDDILIQIPAGKVLDLSLALSALALLGSVLFVSALEGGSWKTGLVIGLLLGAVLFPVPRIVLRYLRKRRIVRFEEQLEDALMSISSSLKAGFSILQAIEEIANENRPPISIEFRLLTQEIRLGIPLPQALDNMTRRLNSPDFELVATAIITARQTGGELTKTLERLAGLIRERMRINGKIRSLTAMGRLQAYLVGAMPFVILFGVNFVAPWLLEGLFDTLAGYLLLGGVLVLDLLGFLVIRKITAIDI